MGLAAWLGLLGWVGLVGFCWVGWVSWGSVDSSGQLVAAVVVTGRHGSVASLVCQVPSVESSHEPGLADQGQSSEVVRAVAKGMKLR